MARRKKIVVELTTTQIDKLWPFFQAVIDDNNDEKWVGPSRLGIMGQATASDEEPGRVRGQVRFMLLTADEAAAVAAVLDESRGR